MSSQVASETPTPPSASGQPLDLPKAINVIPPTTPTSPVAPQGQSVDIKQPAVACDFGEFKLSDIHPRRQRHFLSILHQLPAVPQPPVVPTRISAPKMRSKDLELPFKRRPSNKLKALLSAHTSASAPSVIAQSQSNQQYLRSKHTPGVIVDRIIMALIDQREDIAEAFLAALPSTWMKKKKPYEANLMFLTALAHRMEKIALLMLDRGFPPDVNAPIFSAPKKYAESVPFRINTSLLPSYFIVAVAMGYETIMKFMIKLGANLNQSWNGLTPLHIATYCNDGQPHMNILTTLLEYGADPWQGISLQQVHLLNKMQTTFRLPSGDVLQHTIKAITNNISLAQPLEPSPPPATSSIPPDEALLQPQQQQQQQQPQHRQRSRTQPLTLTSPVVPLLSLPQRPVPHYKQAPKDDPLVRLDNQADSDTTLTENNGEEPKYEEWRQHKVLLPLAFAAAFANRPAVTAILAKMQLTMGGNRRRTFVSSSTLQTRPSNASTSSLAANNRKCAFSLLVQQDPEMTISLLKSGFVHLDQRDPKNATALHLAVRAGNADLAKVLLHFDDADLSLLNAQGENGWTALHEAMSRKQLGLFRMLLRRGADPTIVNDHGDSPRELGQKLGIDTSDVDQIWFAPTQRGSVNRDSASTIMPGTGSTELLSNLDPKLYKMLSDVPTPLSNLFAAPVARATTAPAVGTPKKSGSGANSIMESLDDSATSTPGSSADSSRSKFLTRFTSALWRRSRTDQKDPGSLPAPSEDD